MDSEDVITLACGSGGYEMQKLIEQMRKMLRSEHRWMNTDSDSATFSAFGTNIVFTTDSFVIDPIFFRGGDIGKLSVCGTINDLAVMGATPIGLSAAVIVEEGFKRQDMLRIMESMGEESRQAGVPIVTGDTKVMERGKIDKVVINTSGIGLADKVACQRAMPGDRLIVSGGIAEHGAALLCQRFEIDAPIVSDCHPIHNEMRAVVRLIRQAKDPTRGGIAAILNEMAQRNGCQIVIDEDRLPVRREIISLCNQLGITPYELASEGRFVCIAAPELADEVVGLLRQYNTEATIVGEIREGEGVVLQTRIGKRLLSNPQGRIVPRIC